MLVCIIFHLYLSKLANCRNVTWTKLIRSMFRFQKAGNYWWESRAKHILQIGGYKLQLLIYFRYMLKTFCAPKIIFQKTLYCKDVEIYWFWNNGHEIVTRPLKISVHFSSTLTIGLSWNLMKMLYKDCCIYSSLCLPIPIIGCIWVEEWVYFNT